MGFAAFHVVAIIGGIVGMLTGAIGTSVAFYNLHTTIKNSLSMLEKEVENLKNMLVNIQQKLNDKSVLRPNDPLEWVKDAKKKIDDYNKKDFGESVHQNCTNKCIPNICCLCATWKSIERNIGEVKRLLKKGEEFKLIGVKKCRETTRFIDEYKVIEEIWNEVSPETGVDLVCIHGMTGVGKTVVASTIHDRALEEMTKFEKVIWVSIEHKSSIKDIQEEIACQLPENLSDLTKDENRATRLMNALSSKKILLVLENLPTGEELQVGEIGIPTPGNNMKLIVTSTCHSGCTKVRGKFDATRSTIHEIKPLSQDKAWDLFVKVVGTNRSKRLKGKIYEDTRRAVEELDGLPRAIEMLGTVLKEIPDNDPDRINAGWDTELVALRCKGTLLSNKSRKFFDSFKYTFENLGEVALSCLFFLLSYPKGCVFKATELIKYWKWEGLLDHEALTLEETMATGWEVLNKLSDAHLLQRIDEVVEGQHEESVTMLNIIRLVAMDAKKSRDDQSFIDRGFILGHGHHYRGEHSRNEMVMQAHIPSFNDTYKHLELLSPMPDVSSKIKTQGSTKKISSTSRSEDTTLSTTNSIATLAGEIWNFCGSISSGLAGELLSQIPLISGIEYRKSVSAHKRSQSR